MTARASHMPEGWRLIGPEMLSCPSCRAYDSANAYGAHGSIVRICRHCRARCWGCPACGNGPSVEKDGKRVCVLCKWEGHIPTAEQPAPKSLPFFVAPVEREQAKAELVEVPTQAVEVAPPVAPTPPPEQKKRTPTTRKPREKKTPEGQGSLF